jgi:DNA-binding NtrC family response regulator
MDEQQQVERSQHDARRRDGVLAQALAEMTREMIEDALAWAGGNQKKACGALGCNKVYLWQQIKRYDIDIKDVAARAAAGTWLYKSFPKGAPWVAGGEPAPDGEDW